jgi:phosphoribosylamine--glycine ligase
VLASRGRPHLYIGPVKVLVVGSGAREHAIVRSLRLDPSVDEVVAAPGNPGIAALARCEPLPGGVTDAGAVVALAGDLGADLVVIGPEAPLVAGVADAVRAAGFACFGPSAKAARLEGSKAFAKEVMSAAEVPTGLAHVCTTIDEVADALDALGAPHVVKDDGLAAGKGVVVTDDRDEALEHARACLAKPDGAVVVEEFLSGPEVSLFCLCDGTTVVPLSPAQDFKRVADGDAGPNTGGMGAYSPLDWAPDGLVDDVVRRVAQPVVDEMHRRGTPFVGVLYVGLALTPRGPRVIEFNARFGDPETQVVLARLLTPLGGLLHAAATGRLEEVPPLRWSAQHAVTVVVAAENYPGTPRTGDPITLADVSPGGGEAGGEADGEARGADGEAGEAVGASPAYVLHAGTARDAEGRLVSAGGRVLSVVATGDSLALARARAYAAVAGIHLPGSHHRTDIALLAQRGEITI